GRHLGAHQCEYLDGVGDALYRTKIRKVHEDGLAAGRDLRTEFAVGFAGVRVAVDEVGDYFDGALDVELFDGLIQQIFRDGGYAVGLLDGEAHDRQKAAVAADQCNVGAVQRGDEWQASRLSHGARKMRADRVRNGVVNVENVERLGLEDFDHFCGEGERVWRVIEERVGRDVDFVEENVRVGGIHANRRGVGDEVNVVAARG